MAGGGCSNGVVILVMWRMLYWVIKVYVFGVVPLGEDT